LVRFPRDMRVVLGLLARAGRVTHHTPDVACTSFLHPSMAPRQVTV
jgi:hypothetical protein